MATHLCASLARRSKKRYTVLTVTLAPMCGEYPFAIPRSMHASQRYLPGARHGAAAGEEVEHFGRALRTRTTFERWVKVGENHVVSLDRLEAAGL